MTYDELVAELNAAGNDLRCEDYKRLLVGAGFRVKAGKRGGHHVVTFPALSHVSSFTSIGFNCDHDGIVKKCYVTKFRNHTLVIYKVELEKLLKGL